MSHFGNMDGSVYHPEPVSSSYVEIFSSPSPLTDGFEEHHEQQISPEEQLNILKNLYQEVHQSIIGANNELEQKRRDLTPRRVTKAEQQMTARIDEKLGAMKPDNLTPREIEWVEEARTERREIVKQAMLYSLRTGVVDYYKDRFWWRPWLSSSKITHTDALFNEAINLLGKATPEPPREMWVGDDGPASSQAHDGDIIDIYIDNYPVVTSPIEEYYSDVSSPDESASSQAYDGDISDTVIYIDNCFATISSIELYYNMIYAIKENLQILSDKVSEQFQHMNARFLKQAGEGGEIALNQYSAEVTNYQQLRPEFEGFARPDIFLTEIAEREGTLAAVLQSIKGLKPNELLSEEASTAIEKNIERGESLQRNLRDLRTVYPTIYQAIASRLMSSRDLKLGTSGEA